MRLRTVRYIIKEGFVNTYKNKLMSLTSLVIIIATLVIFGFFLLFILNIETNLATLRNQPQLEVFCYTVLDETQEKQVEKLIKDSQYIESYRKVTKKEAYEKMKERLGENSSALEGYDESIFPVSFIIKLKDYSESKQAVEEFKNITGVEKVSYSQDAIDLISKINYWVKFISTLMIIIFLTVSVFIISNTIKLTVFARRKEINIMKYIGATDWFIRWPFVVEGVIIGLVGACLAFALTSYGYIAVENKFNAELVVNGGELLKMVALKSIWAEIFFFFILIGCGVGAVGSIISLRKHLKV